MTEMLAYETFGDQKKPALMLLHGFMSSNAQWLLNRDALSKHYYLVMVELWGHGNSPTPDETDKYVLDVYLQQFEDIRTAIGIEHWAVIGQSYGAGLIIQYAVHYPHRCKAVVVTNSRSAFGQVASSSSKNRNGKRRRPDFDDPEFSLRKLPYHPVHARRFPETVKAALMEKADAMQVNAVKHGGRLGASLNSINALADLQSPFLLANGKYEKSFQTDLEQLLSQYPTLQVAHLEGGHSVNIEAAESFNAATLDFLAQHHLS